MGVVPALCTMPWRCGKNTKNLNLIPVPSKTDHDCWCKLFGFASTSCGWNNMVAGSAFAEANLPSLGRLPNKTKGRRTDSRAGLRC